MCAQCVVTTTLMEMRTRVSEYGTEDDKEPSHLHAPRFFGGVLAVRIDDNQWNAVCVHRGCSEKTSQDQEV
jgi:hypothetical protein